VKQKIAEVSKALPPGVTIKPFYDRSQLIDRAVGTLRLTLIEEIILVTLAHLLFLGHLRSVLIVTLPLPLSILFAFILMKWTGITSNIMSLSGLAIAIGVLVDAAVVVTEAVIREAHAVQEGRVPGLSYPKDIVEIVRRAIQQAASSDGIRRTRFAVICLPQTLGTPPKTGKDCTSLVVSVPNRPGAVHDLLVPLKKNAVSMTRFESRPAKSGQWEYFFYIDLQGHISEPHVHAALEELKGLCAFYQVLGSYPVND
jgi:hypothetical protein